MPDGSFCRWPGNEHPHGRAIYQWITMTGRVFPTRIRVPVRCLAPGSGPLRAWNSTVAWSANAHQRTPYHRRPISLLRSAHRLPQTGAACQNPPFRRCSFTTLMMVGAVRIFQVPLRRRTSSPLLERHERVTPGGDASIAIRSLFTHRADDTGGSVRQSPTP